MGPEARRGAREIAIFAAAYVTYFGVRAITQGDLATALENADGIIRFEHQAGIAVEGDVQRAFLSSSVLTDAANAVYVYGHWPVLICTGILLFRFRPEQYYLLRNVLLLTGLVGLGVFGLFPVAPPRLTDLPLVDTVTRDAHGYRSVVPASLVNEYAAMPSYHAGWNVLLGIVVFRAVTQWWLRALAVAVAASMTVAVVATANHYVVDVVAGIALVLIGLAAVDLSRPRRRPPTLRRSDVRGRPPGRQRRAPAPARGGAGPRADRG